MFKRARIRLTTVYCLVFFAIFWLFSGGLYLWMDRSFGEGYISTVQSHQTSQSTDPDFNIKSAKTVTIAADISLDKLRNILFILNGIMLIVIPGIALFLTKETLEPIEKNYKKQKQFVSDASHELRTPLTIMQGELDIALRHERKPEEYRAAIKSTREEVTRLHELIEVLLHVARNDKSKSDANLGTVDIIDALTEVTTKLGVLAKNKGVSLVFEPPTARLSVRGTQLQINQLFTNLIDNAIKFTPKNGTVSVSTEPSDKDTLIVVSDTGVGMDKTAQEQAFERFYRADSSRSQNGFGLGLSICKAIVEQHSGTIALTSKPKAGTTVEVSLPRA